jgi:5,6,7,8-tetrahydromethanopterin hydro-lyase
MAFITQFREAFVGQGEEAAHLNTVLGQKGGPVETAWVTALSTPRQGHAAFVASAQPGIAVKPPTLFVNKATIEGEAHGNLTWGAAHAGVAAGVMQAVFDEVIDRAIVEDLLLVAAVWVNPQAAETQLVYLNNLEATRLALQAGADRAPDLDAALAAAAAPFNAYFKAGN